MPSAVPGILSSSPYSLCLTLFHLGHFCLSSANTSLYPQVTNVQVKLNGDVPGDPDKYM